VDQEGEKKERSGGERKTIMISLSKSSRSSLLFAITFAYFALLSPHQAKADECTHTSCPLFLAEQPPNLKENATCVVHIGYIYDDLIDSSAIVKMAVAALNNDTSVLPDCRFELYVRNFTASDESITVATLQMAGVGVKALIVNAEDAYVPASSTISSAYNIPTFNNRAEGDIFIDKRSGSKYDTMTRIYPTSATMTQGAVALIKRYGYKSLLAITTTGTGTVDTLQSQASSAGIYDVFTVSVPGSPTPEEVNATVESCVGYISQHQIRTIFVSTSPATGWLVLEGLAGRSVYGKDYFYILSHDMGRDFLVQVYTSSTRPYGAYPILQGAVVLWARDQTGSPEMTRLFARWPTRDQRYFPGLNDPTPQSQLYVYDGVMTYALALEAALARGGVSLSDDALPDAILAAVPNVSFVGASGLMAFDGNRDTYGYGGYFVYNMLDPNVSIPAYVTRGVYNPENDSFTGPMNITFYGNSPIAPSSAYCEVCVHGTCTAESACACFPGYQGQFCSDKVRRSVTPLAYAPAVAVAFALVVAASVYTVRRRNRMYVEELEEGQGSKIELKDVLIRERIGRGASGEVFKGFFKGSEVAVKILFSDSIGSDTLLQFRKETGKMCTLRHPNIVIFMGSCIDADQKKMVMVMEFCSKGSLYGLLHSKEASINDAMRYSLAHQIVRGLMYLHETNCIHCDLKSHNILLGDNYEVKIADFGVSKIRRGRAPNGKNKKRGGGGGKDKNNDRFQNENELGTIQWTAPEVLGGNPNTEKSDIYALGIILWELFHRKDPYADRSIVSIGIAVLRDGLRPELRDDLPEEAVAIMTRCWDSDPEKRPTLPDVALALEKLKAKNPLQNHTIQKQFPKFSTGGDIYFVETRIDDMFLLFDAFPRAAQEAMRIYNNILRDNVATYEGYEVSQRRSGILVGFTALDHAMNFCVSVHMNLLNVREWPAELTKEVLLQAQAHSPRGGKPPNRPASSTRTLRFKMRASIHVGKAEEGHDSIGRKVYTGPAVKESIGVLKRTRSGFIVVTGRVAREIGPMQQQFLEKVVVKPIEVHSRDLYLEIFDVVPESLAKTPATSRFEDSNDPVRISSRSSSLGNESDDEILTDYDGKTRLVPFSPLSSHSSPRPGGAVPMKPIQNGQLPLLSFSSSSSSSSSITTTTNNNLVAAATGTAILPLAMTGNLKPNWVLRADSVTINANGKIGKGQVGIIDRGYLASRKVEVAVKTLIGQTIREESYYQVIADMAMAIKMNHTNLLRVYGVCVKRNNFSIVTEYAPGGNLEDLLFNSPINISSQTCHSIAAQIASGMNYLTKHNDDIRLHPSFKTHNILVAEAMGGSDKIWVKITDYGQSHMKDLARTQTAVGSVIYTSPEVLAGEPMTVKSSIYSFGIILCELYSRKAPFKGEHEMRIVARIQQGERPPVPNCHRVIQKMIRDCVQEDPEVRPSWHVIETELNALLRDDVILV
jgi:serine/threonine protein kinase